MAVEFEYQIKASSPCHALIIEDDVLIALSLQDMLEAVGFEVVLCVRTVEEALTAVGHKQFDVAILDFQVSDGPTTAVADVLRSAGTPFALYTGFSEAFIRMHIPDAPILSKPCLFEDFENVVTDLVPRCAPPARSPDRLPQEIGPKAA